MLLAPKVEDAVRRIMAVLNEFHVSDQGYVVDALMNNDEFWAIKSRLDDEAEKRLNDTLPPKRVIGRFTLVPADLPKTEQE